MSPSDFRRANPDKLSNIGKLHGKIGKDEAKETDYICNIENCLNFIEMHSEIEINQLPEYQMAALTHIGIQGLEMTFEKIIHWAKSKGLWSEENSKMVRIFHDSFKSTPPNKVRMTIGFITNESFASSEGVSQFKINGSKCIIGRFTILPHQFEKAWSSMYVWMNDQGYRPNEQQPIEIYQNDYRKHPEGKVKVELCIPII